VLSTHDLVGSDASFCLITDGKGGDWVSAAQRLSCKDFKINVAQVKAGAFSKTGDYDDPDGRWDTLREIHDGGAILVRPDNHVAWRSKHPSTRRGEELIEAVVWVTAKR